MRRMEVDVMLVMENGVKREQTPEELEKIAAMLAAQPVPGPTAEERLAALEAAMLELVMGGAE